MRSSLSAPLYTDIFSSYADHGGGVVASSAPSPFRIAPDMHQLLVGAPPASLPRQSQKASRCRSRYFHSTRICSKTPEFPPEKRLWSRELLFRKMRGWLIPYLRSRILPGDFSSHHGLFVPRLQMQHRLLVLLVIQQ